MKTLEENGNLAIQGLYHEKNSTQSYWTLIIKVELSSFRKIPKELNKNE